ncbi:acylphosphatase [Streptomyces sp. ACA25]|uniref:acylphosphatase n=1 Tax=Streptomyces sp. ACA25 TaxID=3022596 RepID=UPI002306E8E0|nr:acylphosphatase [Streptomyces sp. ACA25]MDB1089629.1 acylphosphatase [Streptomyces sp. ACA25]
MSRLAPPDPTSAEPPPGTSARLTVWVRGRVQGVGFRWFTRARALAIGELKGFVLNLEDGRVQVVAEGPGDRCERLLQWLREGDTPGTVVGVTEIWATPRGGYAAFTIR